MKEGLAIIAIIILVLTGTALLSLSADEQDVTYINDTCVHIEEDKRSAFGEDKHYSTIYCETPISAQ